MTLQLREARPADVPRLVEMGTHFIATTQYRTKLATNVRALAETMRRLIAIPQAVLIVAEYQGDLIGMLAVVAVEHPLSGETTASEMFWWVEPAYRGRLGLYLLRAGEAWAQSRGATRIQMIAPDERVAKLYRRRGYSRLEEVYQRTL